MMTGSGTPTPRFDGMLPLEASPAGASAGGALHTTDLSLNERWSSIYPSGIHQVVFLRSTGGPINNVLIEGFRIHGCFDAFGVTEQGSTPSTNSTIRGNWCSMVRDDCIEGDSLEAFNIIDNLIDGCYICMSQRNRGAPDHSDRQTVFDGCLVYNQPMNGESATRNGNYNRVLQVE